MLQAFALQDIFILRKLSLKQKSLIIAVGATLATVAAIGLLLWLQIGRDAQVVTALVNANSSALLAAESEARIAAIASHAAESAATALLALPADDAGTQAARLAERLQPFLDDSSLVRLEISDLQQRSLFSWSRPDSIASGDELTHQTPIRALVEAIPGARTPQTLGILYLEARPATLAQPASIAARLEELRRQQIRELIYVLGTLLVLGLLATTLLARRASQKLVAPLHSLTRSAARLGVGDYSRPISTGRHDEIGELQNSLERLRQRLRQTTITRDYLNSVLGSMNDAVFVTSPDGVIKVVNLATCKLLNFAEEELVGKSLLSVIDESERPGFDLVQASQDMRETLVRTRQGQAIPVSLSGSRISSDDPQFQGVIFVARNITERKRAERRIRYLARYDALTKIPNRMQFQHLLQQSIARSIKTETTVALLYLDMDRFKEINDTLGHAAGDRTLEILSERLSRLIPKDAVVGRLAGDEFAIFVEGLAGAADNRGPISQLARSILGEIGKAIQLDEQEVFLTGSIGMAFAPRDAGNVIDLIRNADAAMYYSKQNGGDSFVFYASEMNAAAVERLMLKSKLRRALERDELLIRYQPKVDLRSGRIVGAEALLRWRLPGHGDIPPSQFIPLAEETNLIIDIGEYVLNQVCTDYKQILVDVPTPGRISLNLSLKQLQQQNFVMRCRTAFRRHSVSPTAFELEITETTLMADAKRTLRLLDELYAMGLHLSIDDFGTGYSSLSALQQFPIGTLKIDQSFVRDVGEDESDATIVRTMIDMGRSLGMDVVAEGVESVRHLEFLRMHHCNFAQGRLFGEPCSIDDLHALLAQQEAGSLPFAPLIPAPRQAQGGALSA